LTSAIRSPNEDLASSRSSPLWKSDNSKTEDTSDAGEDTTSRHESLPKTRTSQPIHSTELEPTLLQSPEVRTSEVSKLEWDNSRSTTLGDPGPAMLDASGTIPPPLSQPLQPEANDVGESFQVSTPRPPPQGEVQSEEAPFTPRLGGVRKDVGDLSEMRLAVVRRRHEAQESRAGLRQEREALDILDARFIQEVRVLYANSRSAELENLFELIEAMQDQRDKFYPMEDDYNKLEDRLDLEEFELHEAESRLYERLGSPRTSIVAADDRAPLWREEYLEPQPGNLSLQVQEPAYTDAPGRRGASPCKGWEKS
jgi:hypothetical protein